MRKKVLVEITEELLAAIDHARGEAPRNPWMEQQLWRLTVVKKAAESLSIKKPHRPLDGRGSRKAKPAR